MALLSDIEIECKPILFKKKTFAAIKLNPRHKIKNKPCSPLAS